HNSNSPRQQGKWSLSVLTEQTFFFKGCFKSQKLFLQCALASDFHTRNNHLQTAALSPHVRSAMTDNRYSRLGPKRKGTRRSLPHNGRNLARFVFQIKIYMPAGGPGELMDLA